MSVHDKYDALRGLDSASEDWGYLPMPWEPGPGQRWSTWDSVMAGQRGPQPRPDWVVTASAAVDSELGILKTGKEADVYLLERAVPDDPAQRTLLAAKRYRDLDKSNFHRSGIYTEGRKTRRSRDNRAVAKKTDYGRQVSALMWAAAEFDALSLVYSHGAAVPYPVQVDGAEILMEFIGDGQTAAPRLAQTTADADQLVDFYEQIVAFMRVLAGLGNAHGDLSPYNLLADGDRIVAIDLPQLVDVVVNPAGVTLLERDCRNICDWFARKGVTCDQDALFGDLISRSLA